MIRIAILDDEKADLEKEEQITSHYFIKNFDNVKLFFDCGPKNSLISTFWMQRCQ